MRDDGPDAQEAAWRALLDGSLGTPGAAPFAEHLAAFQRVYAGRAASARPPPAYLPTRAQVERAHATALARELGLADFAALQR